MAPPHKYDRRPAGAAGGFEDGERDEKFTLSEFERSENESKGVPLAPPHKYDRRPAGAAGGFEDGERDEKFTLSEFERSENESKGVPLAPPRRSKSMYIKKLVEALLWLIFTVYFFYMWWREREKSQQRLTSLDKFNVRKEGGTRFDAGFSPGEAFFAMREELNTANQESHKISANSYFAAAVTSLFSFALSLL